MSWRRAGPAQRLDALACVLGLLGLLLGSIGCVSSQGGGGVAAARVDEGDFVQAGAEAAEGETLYLRLCASCHGEGGQGDGPVAEHLAVALPDLTALAERNDGDFPRAGVEETLRGPRVPTHGLPEMPVWGPGLTAADVGAGDAASSQPGQRMTALLDYLESIQIVSD